jgi:hypothetical protein
MLAPLNIVVSPLCPAVGLYNKLGHTEGLLYHSTALFTRLWPGHISLFIQATSDACYGQKAPFEYRSAPPVMILIRIARCLINFFSEHSPCSNQRLYYAYFTYFTGTFKFHYFRRIHRHPGIIFNFNLSVFNPPHY